jgi:hypothetical protein
MLRPRNSAFAALVALLIVAPGLSGCDAEPDAPYENSASARARLGLMTSLPLYWPLDADMGQIAMGRADMPWQRKVLEADYAIVPLDTLSPIPALAPGDPDSDPLAGIDRLAIIQPRGLSPADNVALDSWVRAGGRLLLVLDPALTGEYDLPLGDPRRPVDTALIPPVVARWGLAVSFDETQSAKPKDSAFAGTYLPLILAGEVAITDPAAADCTIEANGAAARCRVGEGQVTLIADAAVFEHETFAGEDGIVLRNLLAEVFR